MIPLNTSKHLDYLLWKWQFTLLKHKNADSTVKMDIKSKILDIKGKMNNSRTSLMYKTKKISKWYIILIRKSLKNFNKRFYRILSLQSCFRSRNLYTIIFIISLCLISFFLREDVFNKLNNHPVL